MGEITYPIAEVFRSIQGEGYHAGRPAVFVRFAGCNLSCPWCDTDHTAKEHLTVQQLRDRIQEAMTPRVMLIVITGGEPTLHDLTPLLDFWAPVETAIETNGTHPDELRRYRQMKCPRIWITVSPKAGHIEGQSLRYASEVKVVYDPDINLEEIYKSVFPSLLHSPGRLFLQPCSGNIQPALDYVMAHPWWRLSLQTQKMIGVR
jgi:organic radical activating enzyme